jgi:NAD(P)H-quinone oxidoreductase subunit 5
MFTTHTLLSLLTLLPLALMAAALLPAPGTDASTAWRRFRVLGPAALAAAVINLALQLLGVAVLLPTGLDLSLTAAWLAVLVQFLGTVIGSFSSRYLEGDGGQARYAAALAGVLAAVHLLLLADHWVVLIAAWAAVGVALQRLLCFYPDRPFALLAAHKKQLADRLADALLVVAAALAWNEVGSGAFPDLWRHLHASAPSMPLQAAAICLALAVVLRTALLPLHGWLIQVMEAPTPVSALLHAGVVNLGGFVLIRFAPLLEAAPAARWLLVAMGLATAMLSGLVMLTRVSIKVRLAWSTAAQMGFMVMECALGLYTLAMLHLIGHSLYKAHAFLAASGAVQQARLRMMRSALAPSVASLAVAPLVAAAIVAALLAMAPLRAWPVWWTGVLALAWAPLLWWPGTAPREGPGTAVHGLAGISMVAVLTAAALIGHALPFGVTESPDHAAGLVALAGMAVLYVCLAMLQVRPNAMATWRRWSYAGFYLDEIATRAALRLWPTRWTPTSTP